MSRLFLVRHGQASFLSDDYDRLSPLGLEQSRRLGQHWLQAGIEIDEGAENRLAVVDSNVTLADLVDGLNALGIGPRDMITILQAIKYAGALQADIEVM